MEGQRGSNTTRDRGDNIKLIVPNSFDSDAIKIMKQSMLLVNEYFQCLQINL